MINLLFDTFLDRSNNKPLHEEMNMDVVIIPIRDRSKKPEVVYTKQDGVTVINIRPE